MRALVERADGYEVVAIASDNPDAAGVSWATRRGIITFAVRPEAQKKRTFEDRVDAFFRATDVDVIALAGYMRLLSNEFVARWRGRILNIHPSLLPKYRGLDTHARAIEAGDAVSGCSVHLVTEELDAGELLGQAEVPIEPGDTPQTLEQRVLAAEHQLYPKVLSAFVRR